MRARSFIVLITLAMVPAAGSAQNKHPFQFDDYTALHRAAPVAVSQDGKSILYEISYEGNKGPEKHEWHVLDITTGGGDRKLELPEKFQPSGFTKDGAALYGIFELDGKGQLAIVPLGADKPAEIVALPTGIREAVPSPDGARYAVLADPRPKDPLAGIHTVAQDGETSLYVIGRGQGNSGREEGGWWCPALHDIGQIAWSADSTQIAVLSQTPKIGYHDVHSYIDICSASGARRVADIANAASGLAWANGGRDLAFAGTTTLVLTPDHLWTVPVNGGAPVDRTPQLAGSITSVTGDAHGNVWVEMHNGVQVEVDAYRDGQIEAAYRWPEGAVSLPVFPTGGDSAAMLAFAVSDPAHATNVAIARDGQLQKVTHEGDDTLANVSLGEVRVVHWTAKDGTKLEGIVTFPADYQAGRAGRFLVLPHGGPEENDRLVFDLFSRMVAGMGYVVLQPEYRGSTGYGSDFLAAIYQHFGDTAYRDVDSATDFAVAQGWADPNRLAIFGWSAGGFMTSWTVTQTHRYKAAIEGAGITDWLSFIPTSDIGQVDYDARMQEKDPTPFLQYSAVMFAGRVTTPLLILHGESDVRVPTFQGREFYVLLAERGKTVRMVTYPGSPHFPVLSEQRRDVFKELGDWLQKYNP
jgi:dipeptidyl aminopeptidase/acylaminoacyl peptidase